MSAVSAIATSRPSREALLWLLSTASFPVAGIAGLAVAGPAVAPASALVGGAVSGAVIGAAQALTSAGRLPALGWTAATAVGVGVGLALGAGAVGFRTGLGDLAAQGAITGLVLGAAQAIVLPVTRRRKLLWAATLPTLWAGGWAVTTLAGVDVERHYTVFGLTGALAVTVLSGALLTATNARAAQR